jgi:hypothetical protein
MGGISLDFDSVFLKSVKNGSGKKNMFSLPAVLDMKVPKADSAFPKTSSKLDIEKNVYKGINVISLTPYHIDKAVLEKKKKKLRPIRVREPLRNQSVFANNYAEGIRALDDGRYQDSVRYFERALAKNPHHVDAQRLLVLAITRGLRYKSKKTNVYSRIAHMSGQLNELDTSFSIVPNRYNSFKRVN